MNFNSIVNRKFIFYILIAITSALSDLFTFTVLLFSGLNLYASQGISRIIGGITSFVLNKHFTFEKQVGRTKIEARRFLLLYGVSYLLSFCLIWILYNLFQLPTFYAKILTDGSCFLFNFIAMKLYVYANTRGILERSKKFTRKNMA